MVEKTKERILQVAAEKFSAEGIREVSIDDICRKLSISKKTFYQFFPSKEELVKAVVYDRLEMSRKRFDKMTEGKNSVEILVSFCDFVGKKKNIDGGSRMAADVEKYYPDVFAVRAKERGRVVKEYLLFEIRRGVSAGYFRDSIDPEAILMLLCLMYRGMVDYISGKYPVDGKKLSFKSLSSMFEDIVCREMLTEKGSELYAELRNDNNKIKK